MWESLLVGLTAYCVGSVSFALIVGQLFYKIDLRQCGSKSLGATNVLRVLGWQPALIVFSADAGKSAFVMYLSSRIQGEQQLWAMLVLMIIVIIGHSFPFYLRPMKGGKGVAAAAGALFYLMPQVALIELILFIIVVCLTRYVSIASLTIAFVFPALIACFFPGDVVSFAISFAASLLVIEMHRPNIGRWLRGEENRVGERKAA